MSENPSAADESLISETGDVSRRTAVKVAAAAGVGAVVWAEPTLKGLARRPAYASAGSSNGAPQPVTITGDIDAAGNITNIAASPPAIDGFTITLTSQGSPTNDPRLRLQFNGGVQRLIFNTGTTPISSLPLNTPPLTNNGRRLRFDLDPLPPAGMFTVSLEIICRAL